MSLPKTPKRFEGGSWAEQASHRWATGLDLELLVLGLVFWLALARTLLTRRGLDLLTLRVLLAGT